MYGCDGSSSLLSHHISQGAVKIVELVVKIAFPVERG
jgi:hypothetical protein